ncbi:MAG: site-specific integrase [Planctomycetes bacterium]|nr:site-specific integrase [Planctomycetota bacterium]
MGSIYKHRRGKANESKRWCYTVKIEGRWREFIGFTDKDATRTRMVDHQRRVDRGEVGLVDPFEAGKREPLTKLVETYIRRPDAKGQNPRHLVGERERLLLAFHEMGARTFADLDIPRAELFFTKLQLGEVRPGRPTHKGGKPKPRKPASAATVRGYKVTLKAFGRYLHRRGTWPNNPFDMLQAKKLTAADRTRVNRALTPEQIDLLVQAAEIRPVQEWRRTHPNASAEKLESLRIEGVFRGRIYLTLAYTGLRVGELAALTWGELDLIQGQEVAEIEARKQKGRDDAIVVLHPMLAEMLRRHRKECSTASVRKGRGPVRNADKVFRVSSSLLRWLKLDAAWAGIGLCDARGRSTTVHGIRAGFNTTLRRNATDPSLRMRLMRHKSTDLGLGTYDKVEVDELRRELGRLPVASALRAAAGAESVTVPVTVRSGPTGADAGRSGPFDPSTRATTESPNVAHTWPSRPPLAAAGRSWPEPTAHLQNVGPAGLEPATKRV